ncbi:uncharacterized protein LOC123555172 isoform X2 [Mercenaria mercenaria]|uniref:uncharacterized protein LOC123555172 isoform X2 n=1 Tax=Mercenaria mercenaria TaxID=6596 RepID=UPI00234FA061|nr:uncharacterized protein LOC123555172 isoform X2 [Mercenaria mercenaria]
MFYAIVLAVVIGIISVFFVHRRRSLKGKAIPGPKGFPLIGCILELCGELIPDDDPNKDDFWQHTRGGDFFLRSAVNSIMTSFPFLRFLPGKFGEEYRQHKNVDQKIREKYFYDMKKTFTPGKLRGLVDHYIDEQRMEKKSGNDVFFTDERIMVQLSEVIDAGKDISLPIIQCYHSKNNSIMDVFSIAGITSI